MKAHATAVSPPIAPLGLRRRHRPVPSSRRDPPADGASQANTWSQSKPAPGRQTGGIGARRNAGGQARGL
ncbi:hypothetical protein [Xanthobacter tagetidis]|uniref:hypothetical protein n=1 Tax=Xanthobacter tagetidis TaxID=60216 RepID=UPI0011C4A996|nr:hypothetical protein [Xanthobacter tagetidis]MBB6310281.1 hypothetical protein [Xanthobacter tagetidis]